MDATNLPDIANLLSGAIGPSIRAATCTAIAACSSGPQAASFRHLVGTTSDGETIIRRLLVLCADPACSRLALSALVNLSEDEDAALQATNAGGVERCTQALLDEEQRGLYSLYGGLLSNLTRFEAGVDSLLGKGKGEMREIRARGILMALIRRVEQMPNVLWVANVCTKEEGRSILVGEEGRGLNKLLRLGGGEDVSVRLAVASAVRNCAMREEIHKELVQKGGMVAFCINRFTTVSRGPFVEGERAVREVATEPLEEIRILLAEALLLLCKSRVGREALRTGNGYEVLDKLRLAEENQEVLQAIDSVLERITALEDGEAAEPDDLPNSISVEQTTQ